MARIYLNEYHDVIVIIKICLFFGLLERENMDITMPSLYNREVP